MKRPTLRIAVSAWLGLSAHCALSQQPIAIATVQHLSFGRFAAGTGGTVTVSPSGMRTAGPGVVLLSSGLAGEARYTISGDPLAVFSLSLPADDAVTLSDDHGHYMPINLFRSQPPEGLAELGAGGTRTLAVGATLNASAGQAAGNYASTFSILVEYN
ncbi:MAG TPA: DUF4402 domain-containing protein [Solimonas sp.]|nr:DUF4402 domain-containing protein [Solimonas sp.]